MVKLYDGGAYLVNGKEIVPEAEAAKVEALTGKKAEKSEARKGTMAYNIMKAHNTSGNMENLKLKRCRGSTCTQRQKHRRRRIQPCCLSFFPAGIYQPYKTGIYRRPYGSRCDHPYCILRTVLWCRRYSLQ